MPDIAHPRAARQIAPLVIPVIGGKGGIGKSLCAQLIAAKLGTLAPPTLMVDTDHTNSSTKSIEPGALAIDLWDPAARGGVMVALQHLKAGTCRSIVMDTGAQEERFVTAWLEWFARETARNGAWLIPVLPITLSSHNQTRAAVFAEMAASLGVPTIFVRNLGQGRKASDYANWAASKTRGKALAQGAVEIDLPDLGARWTDEAGGLGLSLADAAQGRFEKAEAAGDAARKIFTADVRAWLNIFIAEFGDAFVAGVEEAIAKRAKLARKGS